MTFQMDVIQQCLASWVHLKILETLMRKPRAVSQRQLASIMGIPRATTQRALSDLGETGLIKPQKIGSASYWDFNQQSYLYETLTPLLEGLQGITPPLAYLKKLIRRTLTLPKTFRCLVFGSTVEGRDTPSSDIDMAIILPAKLKTPPPTLENELDILQDLCREKFGKRLTTLFINEKDISKNPDKELYRNILKGMEI